MGLIGRGSCGGLRQMMMNSILHLLMTFHYLMCLPWVVEYCHRYDTYAVKVANVFRINSAQTDEEAWLNLDQDVKDGVNDQSYYLRSFTGMYLSFKFTYMGPQTRLLIYIQKISIISSYLLFIF
jgi:hypothetical protein